MPSLMPLFMRLLVQLRTRLARSPWLYWALVGIAALVVWLVVVDATSALDRERQRWGATRTVLVAARDLDTGSVLMVERRDFPVAMVPESAVTDVVANARARRPLAVGEVVTSFDVAAAAIPTDWVVLAIDPAGQPPLAPGDDVAVFAAGQRWCTGTIVELEPLQVAMPSDCAAAASDQSAVGAVILGRIG